MRTTLPWIATDRLASPRRRGPKGRIALPAGPPGTGVWYGVPRMDTPIWIVEE